MFQMVLRVLELRKGQEPVEPSALSKVWGAAAAFLAQQEPPKGFLLPEPFRLIEEDWDNPARNKESEKPANKLNALSAEAMQQL